MLARVILYIGAVALGLTLLMERPIPMAIAPSDGVHQQVSSLG